MQFGEALVLAEKLVFLDKAEASILLIQVESRVISGVVGWDISSFAVE